MLTVKNLKIALEMLNFNISLFDSRRYRHINITGFVYFYPTQVCFCKICILHRKDLTPILNKIKIELQNADRTQFKNRTANVKFSYFNK